MKKCRKCGEESEQPFDRCWKCGLSLLDDAGSEPVPVESNSVVKFKIFRGTFTTWNSLLSEAAEFATKIGKDRLINVSQSEDDDHSVVVVWFWGNHYSED